MGATLSSANHEKLVHQVSTLVEQLRPDAAEGGVPLRALLNPAFMRLRTGLETLDALFEAGGLGAAARGDDDRIASEAWNAFVRSATPFTDWEKFARERMPPLDCGPFDRRFRKSRRNRRATPAGPNAGHALTAWFPSRGQPGELPPPTPETEGAARERRAGSGGFVYDPTAATS